jgi:hypothetical protein
MREGKMDGGVLGNFPDSCAVQGAIDACEYAHQAFGNEIVNLYWKVGLGSLCGLSAYPDLR